jgi:hypothetical protein|tara:strand:+ start:1220 stop:1468 length:249 start_codon:yes stop_codon:yes gene_type:complete
MTGLDVRMAELGVRMTGLGVRMARLGVRMTGLGVRMTGLGVRMTRLRCPMGIEELALYLRTVDCKLDQPHLNVASNKYRESN